jgi:hypothetical protein
MCRGSTRIYIHCLDFHYNIFLYVFFIVKKTAFICEFQHTPLRKIIFFSIFHTSCMRFWRYVSKSLKVCSHLLVCASVKNFWKNSCWEFTP